jgi:hypothetical protein
MTYMFQPFLKPKLLYSFVLYRLLPVYNTSEFTPSRFRFNALFFLDWLLSNKLNPTNSIISYKNIIFNLLQSFQEHNNGVKQELGPACTDQYVTRCKLHIKYRVQTHTELRNYNLAFLDRQFLNNTKHKNKYSSNAHRNVFLREGKRKKRKNTAGRQHRGRSGHTAGYIGFQYFGLWVSCRLSYVFTHS